MRTNLTTFLLLLIFSITGCRRSADREQQATLEKFSRQMEKIDASILVGMTRSDVVATLDHPMIHTMDTNYGPYSNWVTVAYFWHPEVSQYKSIMNGFVVTYPNDVVIQKQPIIGERH
jgi:hypothetical protein